jgi:hypothetical protein
MNKEKLIEQILEARSGRSRQQQKAIFAKLHGGKYFGHCLAHERIKRQFNKNSCNYSEDRQELLAYYEGLKIIKKWNLPITKQTWKEDIRKGLKIIRAEQQVNERKNEKTSISAA